MATTDHTALEARIEELTIANTWLRATNEANGRFIEELKATIVGLETNRNALLTELETYTDATDDI